MSLEEVVLLWPSICFAGRESLEASQFRRGAGPRSVRSGRAQRVPLRIMVYRVQLAFVRYFSVLAQLG